MKKIYSLLILSIFLQNTLNSQVIFTSSFENWSNGKPIDWFGYKTNIAASAVTEITSGAFAGSSACQLENTTTTHKRFTTQPSIPVTNGTSYNVKFYVKGKGDIRTGMFDNRTTAFGYADYTGYESINSSTWQLISHGVTCANNYDSAQFVFSVKSTDASMDHLQIDSVVISILQPDTVSIYEIQYTTSGNGSSPMNGQPVITQGIVVAKNSPGVDKSYYIQDSSSAWNGIMIFNDTAHNPAIGDKISISGTVREEFGNTVLDNITAYSVLSSGNPAPTPIVLANVEDINNEKYEGVLVKVENGTCVRIKSYGEWHLLDGGDTCRIDGDIYWYNTPQITYEYDVTGIVSYNYGHFRLNPRNLADINETASAPVTTSIYEIQYTTATNGVSPKLGYTVITEGVVTAKNAAGVDKSYYIQDSSLAWNGIMILNDTAHSPVVGDKIRITAKVKEEFNLTVLHQVSAYTILSSNNPAPTPILLGNVEDVNNEMYEGVLVKVQNGTCVRKKGYGEWHLLDGGDTCYVDGDVFWYNFPQLGNIYDVTGVVSYNYNKFRLNPRNLGDIVETVSVEEITLNNAVLKIYPNPTSEFLTIETAELNENTLIDIYSMNGQLVRSIVVNKNNTSVDVSELKAGNYIIHAFDGFSTSTGKFSKF